MSENKLRKFINKQIPPLSGKKRLQPIVLSDSKGRYIERFYRDTTEKQLIIISQSGLKAEESKKWLKRNIAKKIIEHGDIWLYIWIGTCNLTSKNKNYIALRSQTNAEIEYIKTIYKEIIEIIKKYPGSKLTFLETPIYSIKKWNAGKGHKNPETFNEQDEQLSEQIYQLNGIVRDLNKELGSHSPEFSSDLLKNNKHRSGSKRTPKKKRQYNFDLYKDGIHPRDLLAKAWLRKIEEQAKRDCWTSKQKPTEDK